eukprot:264845_1
MFYDQRKIALVSTCISLFSITDLVAALFIYQGTHLQIILVCIGFCLGIICGILGLASIYCNRNFKWSILIFSFGYMFISCILAVSQMDGKQIILILFWIKFALVFCLFMYIFSYCCRVATNGMALDFKPKVNYKPYTVVHHEVHDTDDDYGYKNRDATLNSIIVETHRRSVTDIFQNKKFTCAKCKQDQSYPGLCTMCSEQYPIQMTPMSRIKEFKQQKTTYQRIQTDENIDALNTFLHLLDNPVHLKTFYKENVSCDDFDCQHFARNYRDRQKHKSIDYKTQIEDKIHCFYFHGADIAYNEKFKETLEQSDTITDECQLIQTISFDQKMIKRMRQRILNNPQWVRQFDNRNEKFNQPLAADSYQQNNKMYSFGTQFKYGYDNEDKYTIYRHENEWNDHSMKISAKYSSLKDEITHNNISVLTVDQFNEEYKKANIHWCTDYRKNCYPYIPLELIVSLMIYCNHTELQNKFTQTYYRNID